MKPRVFLSIALLATSVIFFSDPAAAGPLADRFRERAAERAAADSGANVGSDGAGSIEDSMGGGQALSCAEWSQKVKRLERFSRGRHSRLQADLADVRYGPAPLENLDVYFAKSSRTPAPVIVVVHGGGWCVGDKAAASVTTNKVQRWTARGFLFVSINYPMVAEGSDAIDQAEHVAKAVAFVQAHAAKWGGDGQRVILMGHSAGAHLVSLVNADASIRQAFGVRPLLGVVSLDAGAIDVVTQMPNVYPFLKERYREAFGHTEADWKEASPYHRLGNRAYPWLGVCSTTRKDKPCEQAEAYVRKSTGLGLRAEVLPQAMSHGAINNELGLPGEYTRQVEVFLASLDASLARRLRPE